MRRLTVLESDGLERGDDHFVMNGLVHVLHRRRILLLALVLSAEVLAVLLFGALCLHWLSVLGGDDNGVDYQRFHRSIGVLLVFDGHLRLTVRAKPPQRTVLTNVSESFAQLGGHEMRERHA